MIGIATQVFDLDGAIIIDSPDVRSTQLDNFSRRVTRNAALDGTSVVSDFGYIPGDRTFVVAIPAGHDAVFTLADLIRAHSAFTLSTREGAFTAAARDWSIRGNVAIATFLITGTA